MSKVALLIAIPIALGVLAGGVVLVIASLLKVKRRRRRMLAGVVGAVVLASAAAAERKVWTLLYPEGPDRLQGAERAAQLAVGFLRRRVDAQVQALPEYRAWADAQRSLGVPEDELLPRLRRVERRGVARLDGPNMAARVVMTRHLMNKADERRCAALLAGDISDADLDSLLATTFSAGMIEGWFQVARDATVAELRQVPATPPDRELASRAMVEMAAGLPGADRERLKSFSQTISVASDREMCWYGRTIFDQLLTLKGSGSTHFIRFLYAPPLRSRDAEDAGER